MKFNSQGSWSFFLEIVRERGRVREVPSLYFGCPVCILGARYFSVGENTDIDMCVYICACIYMCVLNIICLYNIYA
jgi:hypothetical protein